jgi:hypothetical protein
MGPMSDGRVTGGRVREVEFPAKKLHTVVSLAVAGTVF